MKLKGRIDPFQAVLVLAALGALIYLLQWGPEVHKSLAAAGLLTFATTLLASFRGRMIKRDPKKFEKSDPNP